MFSKLEVISFGKYKGMLLFNRFWSAKFTEFIAEGAKNLGNRRERSDVNTLRPLR